MLAERRDRTVCHLGPAGCETRRHQLDLAAVRAHCDEAVLGVCRQILQIGQAAEGDTGRGQLSNHGLARGAREHL